MATRLVSGRRELLVLLSMVLVEENFAGGKPILTRTTDPQSGGEGIEKRQPTAAVAGTNHQRTDRLIYEREFMEL